MRLASWILHGFFVLAGLIALLAALFNWKWFFATAAAGSVTGHSRVWARIFYGLAGMAILSLGILGVYDNLR